MAPSDTAAQPAHSPNTSPAYGYERTISLALAAVLIWAVASSVNRPAVNDAGAAVRAAEVRGGVDPNTAPWWELAALPGVGEVTAKAIVAHRESVAAGLAPGTSVFRECSDLDDVRGIGPKTLERIGGYLILPGRGGAGSG